MGHTALVGPAGEAVVVRIEQLTKRYRQRVAVKGFDLRIRKGEIYGLIGPPGAGKSTLMKAVAGVLEFDCGDLEVFGVRIESERAAERIKARLGFLPQGVGHTLFADLSVDENIDFCARLRLVPEGALQERKRALLAMTRLERFRARPVTQLSGGMQRKLALVCTLIHQPDLMILDEPTTGLDPVSRQDFWAVLTDWRREHGTTVLISTADFDDATRCDELTLLYEGQALASGAPEAILARVPGTKVVVKARPQIEALSRLRAALPGVQSFGSQLHVFAAGMGADQASACIGELLAGLWVQGLYCTEPGVEDVFVALLWQRGPAQPQAPAAGSHGEIRRRGIAIEADALVRDFGRFRAVDHVSFRVGPGEIFGLLGPNGAGKTTVIKLLTGILAPTEGQGRVAGQRVHPAGPAVKYQIGYMSQAFCLYSDLSVRQNLRLFAGIYGLGRAETARRVAEIVELTGLRGDESQLAGSAPSGVRKRLVLGCALLHRPSVLILDQPTAGMDPLGRHGFWDIVVHLSREDGVAILVTTHDMSEVEHCDRVGLMYAGRLVANARPNDLKRQVEVERGQLLELVTDQPTRGLALIERSEFSGAVACGQKIRLYSRDPAWDKRQLRDLLASNGITVKALSPRPLGMEDVFIHRVLSLERQERASSVSNEV